MRHNKEETMSVNFKPLADFVLIEPIPKNMTPGGLALPDDAKTGPTLGRVIKVGPGRVTETGFNIPVDVQEGNVVYLAFAYQEPMQIDLPDVDLARERTEKKYLLCRSRDLMGKNE
jgi:co-chaperonin GroES (HSP10)